MRTIFDEQSKITNIDLFNNKDSDECKSKLNELLSYFIEYINKNPNRVYNPEETKVIEKLFENNKEAILFFTVLSLDTLGNQSIDEVKLNNEDLSFINGKKQGNNLNLTDPADKKLIINQVRNAFAHKSGKINFYKDGNNTRVKIQNKSWFEIDADLDKLINVIYNVTSEPNNILQNQIANAINCIEINKYKLLSDDQIRLLSLSFLMCYNKESIFDEFMSSQSSFINASMFNVNSTSNWSTMEKDIKKSFFEKYNIMWDSKDSKKSYDNEWKSIYDLDNKTIKNDKSYIYSKNNMPFDIYTNKHIPVPLFMTNLRNACSHGRIAISMDTYKFYDKESENDPEYMLMEISKKDLSRFLDNDFFYESVRTSLTEHKGLHDKQLYLLERAASANDFNNFVSIYKNRFKEKTELEVINYMLDNNKISTYLMEYPNNIDCFLKYTLEDGTSLISYIAKYYHVANNHLIELKNKINKYDKNVETNIADI